METSNSDQYPLSCKDFAIDQLLDIPYWSEELKEGEFERLEYFENSLIVWEDILQQELERYDYNTFGSFVEFYHSYRKQSRQTLREFISQYQTKISIDSMSCVAQSLFLLNSLAVNDLEHGSLFSLVSCEEMVRMQINERKVQNIDYQLESKDNIKEHVLVCLKFKLIEENRCGYVLLDPGYHISRPIIVMNDSLYPHTGWFNVSKNRRISKDHCYRIINDQYIAWIVRETSLKDPKEILKQYANIIYIKREFIKYASVTEKRACIFSFKSFVIRNRKGPVAGFYSSIDERNLVTFYEEENGRVTHRFCINDIDTPELLEQLYKIAAYKKNKNLNANSDETVDWIQESVDQFYRLLMDYRQSLDDEQFRLDLCQIDKRLEE